MQIVGGRVLKVEERAGQTDGRSWGYRQAHILDGVQVHVCRAGEELDGVGLYEGLEANFTVEVGAYRTRAGAAGLSIRLVDVELLDQGDRFA